jgi:hypothetical protein
MVHGAPPPDETTLRLADLVRKLRSEPRSALLSLRALALSLGPDVVERVGPGDVTYVRRERPFLTVDFVRTRLVATFPSGVRIHDPMGRLLKRGDQQYFRLDGSGDLDAHVQQFVREAYAQVRQA